MGRRLALQSAVAACWWLAEGLVGVGEPLTTRMTSAVVWIPITVMALVLASRFPLSLSRYELARHLPAHLGGLAVAVLVRAALEPASYLGDAIVGSLQNNVFLYMLLTAAAHAAHYFGQFRLRHEQLSQAELQALRAQIQPHFLFNALNTIAWLIHEAPDRAEEMVIKLSDLLRSTLDSDGMTEVPLRAEIEVLRSYLEIEQVRFADRLSVDWDVSRATLDALVPPLLLQPLAENAVRHGLRLPTSPCELRISAKRRDGWLDLAVEDNGGGLPLWGFSEGIGLTNARERLRHMYGSRHAFTVGSRPGGGVIANLTLPYRVIEGAQCSVS